MKEKWVCIKEYKSNICNKNSNHIPNDKIYVSNTGKVRLNNEELSFGHGLYINQFGDICILGCGWPEKTMHRTIYKLFIKEPYRDVYHNIHHKDFNHLNNHIDNLIELTAKEHGDIHKGVYDEDIKEYIQSLIEQKDIFIEETKRWLKQRVLDYLNDDSRMLEYKSKKQKEKEDKEIKKQIKKQKEIEDKIASGNYYYNKAGVLRKKTSTKKGYVMPKEEREKHSIANKQAYINNPELKNRSRESIEKMRKTLSNTRQGSKLITNEDGTRTWKYKEAIL